MQEEEARKEGEWEGGRKEKEEKEGPALLPPPLSLFLLRRVKEGDEKGGKETRGTEQD